jgi:hypothetical protein
MLELERLAREKALVQPVPLGTELAFGTLGERDELVHLYSWAIPNEDALRAIAAHGPILEVGAGNGYWAQLLTERGVDVLAFDPVPFAEGHYAEVESTSVICRDGSSWIQEYHGEDAENEFESPEEVRERQRGEPSE